MLLHRFIIGITFNERMFRLQSISGLLIDEILKVNIDEKKKKEKYFTQVSTSLSKNNDYAISLIDDKKENSLTIHHDQILFTKTSVSDGSSANIEKVLEEFEMFWKISNKIVNFPATRRIGFVGEYRIEGEKESDNGRQLVKAMTKFNTPDNCRRFQLTYEDRDLNKNGSIAKDATDDFWNKIFTFYVSEVDETPDNGKINANIDVQKYYNPAKKDPLKEIKIIKTRYSKEKSEFKKQLTDLGLV